MPGIKSLIFTVFLCAAMICNAQSTIALPDSNALKKIYDKAIAPFPKFKGKQKAAFDSIKAFAKQQQLGLKLGRSVAGLTTINVMLIRDHFINKIPHAEYKTNYAPVIETITKWTGMKNRVDNYFNGVNRIIAHSVGDIRGEIQFAGFAISMVKDEDIEKAVDPMKIISMTIKSILSIGGMFSKGLSVTAQVFTYMMALGDNLPTKDPYIFVQPNANLARRSLSGALLKLQTDADSWTLRVDSMRTMVYNNYGALKEFSSKNLELSAEQIIKDSNTFTKLYVRNMWYQLLPAGFQLNIGDPVASFIVNIESNFEWGSLDKESKSIIRKALLINDLSSPRTGGYITLWGGNITARPIILELKNKQPINPIAMNHLNKLGISRDYILDSLKLRIIKSFPTPVGGKQAILAPKKNVLGIDFAPTQKFSKIAPSVGIYWIKEGRYQRKMYVKEMFVFTGDSLMIVTGGQIWPGWRLQGCNGPRGQLDYLAPENQGFPLAKVPKYGALSWKRMQEQLWDNVPPFQIGDVYSDINSGQPYQLAFGINDNNIKNGNGCNYGPGFLIEVIIKRKH